MSGHYGIDTASDDHVAAIQAAQNAWGKPAFCGLYLPDFPTNQAVIRYCLDAKIAIAPIYNGNKARGTGNGTAYANEACNLWEAEGLPKGRMILMDIEQADAADGETIRQLLVRVAERGYVGGVYCNPQFGNNHAAAWQYARRHGATGVYYTSQNEVEANATAPVREFRTGLGQGDWASVVPGYEGDCVLWQTWENNLNGTLDLDCASDRGLALMWGATPPPPAVAVLTILRTVPRIDGAHAINPQHQPVLLQIGQEVRYCPAPDGPYKGMETTPHWVHIALPDGPVHGWMPRANLRAV